MFIPDGSNYEYGRTSSRGPEPSSKDYHKWHDDYRNLEQKDGLYSWGWIGDNIPKEHRGWTSEEDKQKLISFLKKLPKNSFTVHYYGWHDCEICSEGLGTSSLCVFYNGKMYRAPSEVVHYVEQHDYNPGKEVVEALYNGKIRTSDEELEEWRKQHEKLAQEKRKKEEERIANLTPQERAKIKRVEEYHEACQLKITSLKKNNAFVD